MCIIAVGECGDETGVLVHDDLEVVTSLQEILEKPVLVIQFPDHLPDVAEKILNAIVVFTTVIEELKSSDHFLIEIEGSLAAHSAFRTVG